MNPYFQQVTPKLRIQEKNRNVDPNLFPERGEKQSKFGNKDLEPKGRFYVISKLENCVSILQIARINIEKINNQLEEMGRFLEKEVKIGFTSNIPISVVNNYLSERVTNIKMLSEAASFQGRALLNGNCGVRAIINGKGLHFVKGSPHVHSSDEKGYPVKIIEMPAFSSLIGSRAMTPDILRKEEQIVVSDNEQELKYKVENDETIESLIPNLQRRLHDKGLNISVFRTKNNFLYFKNNQLGSNKTFTGTSLKTQIVSKYPGQVAIAKDGKDIVGEIGNGPAKGDGGYLTGTKENKNGRGLTLYFNGTVTEYVNQVAGHILVKQNGLVIPLDLDGKKAEMLSLPSLTPDLLATGIPNSSGFLNLKAVNVHSNEERKDALLLIYRSIKELKSLNKDLIIKEDYYVNLAIEMLRLTMKPKVAGVEILSLSKEKASEMAEQLKGMLSPQLIVEPSN